MKTALLFLALALPLTGAAADKPAYKVGDRLAQSAPAAKTAFRTITWDALMPKDWDPMAPIKKLDLSKLQDGDPKANEALAKLREAWDNAPLAREMEGQAIRMPGFVIPIEKVKDDVTEFLLVPYFGACIHTPPPPVNQIVYVVSSKPIKMQTMDPYWVSGKLKLDRRDSPFGPAGYRLELQQLEPYKRPGEK